jgi:hypothetical protein
LGIDKDSLGSPFFGFSTSISQGIKAGSNSLSGDRKPFFQSLIVSLSLFPGGGVMRRD